MSKKLIGALYWNEKKISINVYGQLCHSDWLIGIGLTTSEHIFLGIDF